jgi:hypothetical protein
MSDLWAEIPAYLAIVVAGGTFLWTEHRYRSIRTAKRAAGPTTDTREALESARTDFDTIIGLGGRNSTFFHEVGRAGSGQHLHDLSDRTADPALGALLLEVSTAWDNTWALAPAARGPAVVYLDGLSTEETSEEKTRRKQTEQQIVTARSGRDKCQEALDRLNELEREIS